MLSFAKSIQTEVFPLERTYSAPAAKKTLCLLELMAAEDKPFSVTELATRLNVPVNSVFRILKEMESLQYIIKNPQDSTYTLTAKLYYLGASISTRVSLKNAAAPYLTRLRALTRETTLLTTFGNHYSTLIMDQKVSSEPIKFISTVGLEYASYSSAMGKAMLAWLPPAELKTYLIETELVKVTDSTIISPEILRKELALIRQNGYSTDMEESVPGLKCIAAPIFSMGEKLEGAIGVSVPSFRLSTEKLQETIQNVREQAAQLSSSLGYAS